MAVHVCRSGHQDSQEIVNLCDCPHGAAGTVIGRMLIDAEGGLEPFNRIKIGARQFIDKLPGISGKRFNVLPLAFGKNGANRQTALTGPTGSADHRQFPVRYISIDIFQIIFARTTNPDYLLRDFVFRHFYFTHPHFVRNASSILKGNQLAKSISLGKAMRPGRWRNNPDGKRMRYRKPVKPPANFMPDRLTLKPNDEPRLGCDARTDKFPAKFPRPGGPR